MRRMLPMLLFALLILSACGGSTADTTVADPPNATAITTSDNAQVNTVLESWKAAVPQEMQNQKIKAETIEQKTYKSTSSLADIASYYDTQLLNKGWVKSARMPGVQNGILLTGYDITNRATLVIGAIDESTLGGSGVVVYTAKGDK